MTGPGRQVADLAEHVAAVGDEVAADMVILAEEWLTLRSLVRAARGDVRRATAAMTVPVRPPS